MNKESTNTIKIDELSKIRNKQKITVEALADSLKVSKDFINAIESGNFERLGAPTFVKGHVSNYCRALDLPVDTVLQQIPEKFLQSQTLMPSDARGASPLARVRRKSNHLGKYAVGTALLSMLALSFYFVWDKWSLPGGFDENSSAITASTSQTGSSNKQGGKNITYSSMIPQVKIESNDPVQDDEPASESPVSDDGEDVDTMPSLASGNEAEEGSVQGLDQTVESLDDSSDLQAMAGYSIQLQLAEEAWVSIETNEGEKLEHNLVGPGTYNYVTDKPVHFRIGNAQSSQVSINNSEINVDDFIRNDIADFNWPLIDPS